MQRLQRLAFSNIALPMASITQITRLRPSLCDQKPGLPPDGTLQEERAIFVNAFTESYSKLPAGALGLPAGQDLLGFLHEAFDEEEATFQAVATGVKEGDIVSRFYRAAVPDGIDARAVAAGYLSVDVADGGRSAYMRQLAVLPAFQNRGIARRLVQFAIRDVEGVESVTVSYRAFNDAAARFYSSVGFVPAEECHDSLDAQKYRGMVWYAGSTKQVDADVNGELIASSYPLPETEMLSAKNTSLSDETETYSQLVSEKHGQEDARKESETGSSLKANAQPSGQPQQAELRFQTPREPRLVSDF